MYLFGMWGRHIQPPSCGSLCCFIRHSFSDSVPVLLSMPVPDPMCCLLPNPTIRIVGGWLCSMFPCVIAWPSSSPYLLYPSFFRQLRLLPSLDGSPSPHGSACSPTHPLDSEVGGPAEYFLHSQLKSHPSGPIRCFHPHSSND